MARSLDQLDDLEVMALTVWGEARGEDETGRCAVAWVIRNRSLDPGRDWWGDTVREVCLKPWQFSVWNKNDPNRAKMLNLSPQDPVLGAIRSLCRDVLQGTRPDPTGGCTHYCRHDTYPAWKIGRSPKIRHGRHEFYAIGPGA
jgi:spore germination cell wall hydrolase CwlJ-like protein